MKRIFAVALIGALVTGVAFADIELGSGFKVSGWGTARLTPLTITGDDTSAGFDWGKIGVTTKWSPESGKIGIQFDTEIQGSPSGTYTNWGVSDNAKLWVKPFDMLKLTYGKFVEDDFRGGFAGSDDDVAGRGGTGGQNGDWVFSRFLVGSGNGLHIALNPIEALKIEAAVDLGNAAAGGDISDVYGTIQIGVGYTIADVGVARFQFIAGTTENAAKGLGKTGSGSGQMTLAGFGPTWGSLMGGDDYDSVADTTPALLAATGAHRIEGAFKVTAVPNLGLDIGFKVPLAYEGDLPAAMGDSDKKPTIQQDYLVAAFGNYKLSDPLSLDFQVIASFGGKLDYDGKTIYENPFGLYVFVQPKYNLNDDVGFGAHIALLSKGTYKVSSDGNDAKEVDDSDSLTFFACPWVKKQLGGGNVKLGLGLKVPAGGQNKDADVTVFIPLTFEYSF
jgi:hypothetical protein